MIRKRIELRVDDNLIAKLAKIEHMAAGVTSTSQAIRYAVDIALRVLEAGTEYPVESHQAGGLHHSSSDTIGPAPRDKR
jgi:hypothetical protein